MFCLVKKCKLLKAKSKEWNKTQFANIFRQLRLVDAKLMAAQAALVVNQDDINLQQKQEILLNKRSKLLSFSHEYQKQKSKSNFLINGDANTSFFHVHASIRRNRNPLKEFTSASNVVITNPSDISKEISKEFQDRFDANPRCSFSISTDFALISPVISEDDNLFLIIPVLGEEIRSATFDLAPDKSPGPDGFPPFFFQKYWTLVGNSVIRAVQAFFQSGKIL